MADQSSADRVPGDRGWKPGSFTELRVHGVGNTALDRLLDDREPRQVAGDEVAGFFRSRVDRPLIIDPALSATAADGYEYEEETLGSPDPPQTEDWRNELRWTDVEAYDWGGFNTGGGWKAMWLFLIPFTLANVAGWLVAGRNRLAQRWVRVFGLGISLLFVTWLGAVVIDLVALRCGWQQACYDRQVWLAPYSWPIFSSPPSRMAFALLVPLAVTFVLWYLPGRRGHLKYERQTPETREALRQGVSAGQQPDPDDEGKRNWLRNPNIWARDSEVRLDASLHGAAILGTLGGCVAWANWDAKGRLFDLLFVALGAVLLLLALLMVLGWSPFARGTPELAAQRSTQTRWIGWSSIVFIAVIIGTSFIPREFATVDWSEAAVAAEAEELSLADFESFLADASAVEEEAEGLSNSLRTALFIANGVVLFAATVVLAVVAFATKRSDAWRNGRLWGRWGPLAALLAGLAIAASLVAGAALWLEEWLGDRPSEHLAALGIDQSNCVGDACELVPTDAEGLGELGPVQDRLEFLIGATGDLDSLPLLAHTARLTQPREEVLAQPVIALPAVYDLASLGFLAMGFVMLVAYAGLEIRLRRSIRRDAFPTPDALRTIADDKVSQRTPDEQRAWRSVGVREMRKSPRLTRLHHLFWPPAYFVLIYGVFLAIDGFDGRLEMTEIAVEEVARRASWLFTLARWVITGAIVVVATLVYRSYKPEAQESFGGMWDVISFWPRHYHPFAVPSYGERAVPELAQRITHLSEGNGEAGGCLVSAHSGGVVISIAALALLDGDTRSRVGFLSYGSPTGALYGRAYPEYFDTERLIEDVALGIGDAETSEERSGEIRWLNLWRLTDWTGGYSFGPSRDRFKEYRASDPIVPPTSRYSKHVDDIEHMQLDPAGRTLRESPDFDPVPTAIGHTDYLHDPKHLGAEDPRYQSARGALLRMMT